MATDARAGSRVVPAVAAALAVAYLLAVTLVPILLAPLTIAAVVAACAIVLTRRRSRALVLFMAAIGAWLASALAVAWILQGEPRGGLLWVVGGLFVLPLPLVPWLYSRSFSPSPEPRAPSPGPGGGPA